MEKNNKSTIILIVIIAFLMLAIGICAGALIVKQHKTIINNYEQSKGNESVETGNNTEVGKEENKTEEKNEEISVNGNVLGLEGQFIDLNSAAIITKDIDGENSSFEVDLNNDGKKEKITIEEFDGLHRISIDEDLVINGGHELIVVDIDKSDNYLDIITFGSWGGGYGTHTIYKFNGKKYSSIGTIDAYRQNLYLDQKGKIITPYIWGSVQSNPIIAESYFSYNEAKYVDIDISKYYSNTLIEFTGYFTEDLENEDKIMMENVEISEENCKKCGIVLYENVKCYLIDIVEKGNSLDNMRYKVQLQDGTVGYFVGMSWAG